MDFNLCHAILVSCIAILSTTTVPADEFVNKDLVTPEMTEEEPAAGWLPNIKAPMFITPCICPQTGRPMVATRSL